MEMAMNLGPKLPKAAVKACPTKALSCTLASTAPLCRSTTPVVRMTRAVRVHTTMVSANTSNTPHMP